MADLAPVYEIGGASPRSNPSPSVATLTHPFKLRDFRIKFFISSLQVGLAQHKITIVGDHVMVRLVKVVTSATVMKLLFLCFITSTLCLLLLLFKEVSKLGSAHI